MAIKEIKREWSPCQLDYVKTYLLHSEADVKDLPKCCVGSKATVSETDNEYYCTESGWKLGSELGGSSEVVILPETELTNIESEGNILFVKPSATPTAGAMCKVTYNGTAYDCPAMETDMDGMHVFAFGDTERMGLADGNSDATFIMMLVPDGFDASGDGMMVYGFCEIMDDATSVTLSIVQTEGASADSGSGGGESMVFTTMATHASDGTVTLDKSYDELVAAYKAGKLVKAMIVNGGMTLTLPAVSLNQDSGNDNLYFSLYMKISSSMSMWASLSYDNKNGTITYDGGY